MFKIRPRLILFILLIVTLAILIDIPKNPDQNLKLGGVDLTHRFDTHLGLDLVGGVQALLEADIPADQVVDPGAMSSARAIVENRVNGLGVNETVVQQAGDRRILVELPGEKDPEKALSALQKTGLLEFVDFSGLSAQEVTALQDQAVVTDFGQSAASSSGSNPGGQVYHTVMTGAGLSTARATIDKTGRHIIAFELTPQGTKIFGDFTTNNVGKFLGIVLDKHVISAPSIRVPITNGQGVIEGNFTYESANQLAVQLRYGSLPIPLKVVTTQTVGPTLGKASLQKSMVAGIIGLTVVILFMALYYRLPGVVADLALGTYALLTLALFKVIPVTLTLPGIAGFVLSMGVAVDANILIFERLKEELRSGKPLRMAIDLGWKRAWPSIRDSNFSTLITCLILFWFGSTFGASIVKGFSLTLAVGVVVSMFTAIIVTRTFLHLVLDNLKLAEHHGLFGV